MDYFVYIIESATTGGYYIGHTNNLESRLKRHNQGSNRSTKNGIPWRVIWKHKMENRARSMKLEKKLKNLKSRTRLIKYIEGMN
jgi:putative endonuclease